MWKYNETIISSVDDMPEDVIGFVYEVTHIPSNKKYIGKKILKHKITRPPLKGYKRKRIEYKESDWKTYYGSHTEIVSMIKENKQEEFERKILCFAKTKKYLSYMETKYQFIYEVLEHPDKFFNSNIAGKWYNKDIEH